MFFLIEKNFTAQEKVKIYSKTIPVNSTNDDGYSTSEMHVVRC